MVREREEADRILRLADAGQTQEAISLILNMPQNRVHFVLEKHRPAREQPVERPTRKLRGPGQPPDPPAPKSKPNPVADSAHWLGGRLREIPGKGFFLDGVPASTMQVVKAANQMRVNMGESQIGPEIWHVPVPEA